MFRTLFNKVYSAYKMGITAPNVATDQPVAEAKGTRELGILVYNPTAITMDVVVETVHRVLGRARLAVGAGTVVVTTDKEHGIRNGESVLLEASNSTPTIDGTYVVANVTPTTFEITATTTVAGECNFYSPLRYYAKLEENISESRELIADHTGGEFRIRLESATAGPWADPVDIHWRAM